MSLTTWTPAAIASKAAFFTETICRLVVKNSRTSISKITDTHNELIQVENVISQQINNFTSELRDLHPLMQQPFIAKAYPGGSRFRGQFDSGVFYGVDTFETAAAERGYHHHLFVKNSPELTHSGATPFTFFTVKIAMNAVDVRKAPFKKEREVFENRSSYIDSQRFASLVRRAGVPGIKYASVRNPGKGSCVAMLSPSGFASKQPDSWDENWSCLADSKGARWFNNSLRSSIPPLIFTYE